MLSLTTHFTLRSLAGPSPATVRVRNLSTRTTCARDAWGRSGKEQPLLVSASIEFTSGFARAGTTDSLGGDTVHYGTLSKAILASTESPDTKEKGTAKRKGEEEGLAVVVDNVWRALTGRGIASDASADGEKGMLGDQVRFLSVTARLPKASLLGAGVSYTVSECFGERAYASSLSVHELRVPTLVGINANERLAKQFVVATVTVEGIQPADLQDGYTELERLAVKTMEDSSFETLEALARHIGEQVMSKLWHGRCKEIHVQLEKPTAVPLADTPVVEMRLNGTLRQPREKQTEI